MTTKTQLQSGDVFTHDGHTYKLEIERDECYLEPWKISDGHGVVTDWVRRSKRPGEYILAEDRGLYRYYDYAASLSIARKDGWGLSPEQFAEISRHVGRSATPAEVTAAAVQADYERLRDWCRDEWYYVAVTVTRLKPDSDAPGGYFETRHRASIGGVESDAGDYLNDIAFQLAAEV